MIVMVGEMGEESDPVALRGRCPGGSVRASGRARHNGERGELAQERSSRMADQVGPGTAPGVMGESSGLEPQDPPAGAHAAVAPAEALTRPGEHVPFHGRRVSWVEVSIILAGFIVGGVGLIAGPTWWLVWTGGAIVAVGGILSLATGIFNDWY
jgi:hypothetical protein